MSPRRNHRPTETPSGRPNAGSARRRARSGVRPGTRPGGARKRKSQSRKPGLGGDSGGERLQKVLAAAGVGSRRKCEELITSGRVEVDRQVVTALGTRVQPGQEVRLDGQVLKRSRPLYYAVNKPPGVVSTNYDQAGRPRVIDLLPERSERLFTVGRLDLASEGLILVTNDGLLAQGLTHPRYGVEKTYEAQVAGLPNLEIIEQLRQGVRLAEGFARPRSVRVKSTHKQSTIVEIVLQEGKNREIRRLLAKVGHKVLHLKRVAVDGIKLADLPSGHWRRLYPDEVNELRRSITAGRKRGQRRPETSDGPRHVAGPSDTDPGEDEVIEPPSVNKQTRPPGRPHFVRPEPAHGRSKRKRPPKPSHASAQDNKRRR
jgi:23S rRNA pseudouridine2605 synthase